jgi:hypothetical protein
MSEHSEKQIVGVMRLERRTAQRFTTSFEVILVSHGQVMRATAVDVSMTGMRMTSETDLGVGTELCAHFSLPGSTTMYELNGKIVWSIPSSEIVGSYVAGLVYGNLTARTLEAMALLLKQIGGDDLPNHPADLPTTPPPRPSAAALAANKAARKAAASRQRGAGEAPAPSVPPAAPAKPPLELTQEPVERLLEQARSAQRAQDVQTAVGLFRRALDLAPDASQLMEELAAAVYLAGDIQESARLFDRALRFRLKKGD